MLSHSQHPLNHQSMSRKRVAHGRPIIQQMTAYLKISSTKSQLIQMEKNIVQCILYRRMNIKTVAQT